MKIAHPKINTVIEFQKQEIVSIVIEDKHFFEEFLLGISNQVAKKEEGFVFSIDDKICSAEKHFDMITSPLELCYRDRRMQKLLFDELSEEIFSSDIAVSVAEGYAGIRNLLETVRLNVPYEIEISSEMILIDILKLFNVKLEEPKGTFAERFLEYASNMNRLLGHDIFVLANCDAYLEKEEYVHLEKWVQYHEAVILFVRNQQLQLPVRQNEYIIDKGFCEIHGYSKEASI